MRCRCFRQQRAARGGLTEDFAEAHAYTSVGAFTAAQPGHSVFARESLEMTRVVLLTGTLTHESV
jgi:hypothetical protein